MTLQHVLSTSSPELADVSKGGASFEVRQVYPSTITSRPKDKLFEGRGWVAVKHARVEVDGTSVEDVYSELAAELQILRHPPLLKHENIIDLLAVIYHDAGAADTPNILPALVMEWAYFGNAKDYQLTKPAIPYAEKLNIIRDTANGLKALHDCGLIHGDVKPSNLLVCRHSTRSFVVKLTDFGFALSETDKRPLGYTKNLEAPEIHMAIDPRYHRQLDIYSYGILVHTIFRDGVPYHESIQEEGREAEILRIKQLGIYNTAVQVDFLLNLKDDICPALLICKILAYSLLLSPGSRFIDMSEILSILHSADISHQPDDEVETTPLLNDIMYSFSRTMYSNIAHNAASMFSACFSTDIPEEIPMVEVLHTLCTERVDAEIEYWAKSPKHWRGSGPFCRSIVTSMMTYARLMPSNGTFFNTILSFLAMNGVEVPTLLPEGAFNERKEDIAQ
jgi:serine/threonine protein kinase